MCRKVCGVTRANFSGSGNLVGYSRASFTASVATVDMVFRTAPGDHNTQSFVRRAYASSRTAWSSSAIGTAGRRFFVCRRPGGLKSIRRRTMSTCCDQDRVSMACFRAAAYSAIAENTYARSPTFLATANQKSASSSVSQRSRGAPSGGRAMCGICAGLMRWFFRAWLIAAIRTFNSRRIVGDLTCRPYRPAMRFSMYRRCLSAVNWFTGRRPTAFTRMSRAPSARSGRAVCA